MAYKKWKKGGSGGKLGHSNMSHWDYTETIKLHSKKTRRLEEREIIQSELDECFRFPKYKAKKKPVRRTKKAPAQEFMSKRQVNEVIEILSKKKNHFYYFKDYYAFLLLNYVIGDGLSIKELAKTRFSRLLQKPAIKKVISKAGDGKLTKDKLFAYLPPAQECYLLTLGEWGEERDQWSSLFSQTSRPGKNLVLQLNFSNKHNAPYYKLIDPKEYHPFEYYGHPTASKGYHTLAWSRIDISDDYSYALIEEIQNDWIQLAISQKTTIETITQDEEGNERVTQQCLSRNTNRENSVKTYIEKVLTPHIKLWDEAILASTIWLLREEIGVAKIYYHTFDSGNILKGITSSIQPPKSIYTKLPEKFCFGETDEVPDFLQDRASQIKQSYHDPIQFYLLDFKV